MDEPDYDIRIRRPGRQRSRGAAQLRRAIRLTLQRHACPTADISVTLLDDRAMARLNRKYLGHSAATDVISLDYRDRLDEPVCGELYISRDTALRQARRLGHTLSAELCLYAVHGTLHLLGYDDVHPADAARMHAKENALLTQLGLGPVYGRPESRH